MCGGRRRRSSLVVLVVVTKKTKKTRVSLQKKKPNCFRALSFRIKIIRRVLDSTALQLRCRRCRRCRRRRRQGRLRLRRRWWRCLLVEGNASSASSASSEQQQQQFLLNNARHLPRCPSLSRGEGAALPLSPASQRQEEYLRRLCLGLLRRRRRPLCSPNGAAAAPDRCWSLRRQRPLSAEQMMMVMALMVVMTKATSTATLPRSSPVLPRRHWPAL